MNLRELLRGRDLSMLRATLQADGHVLLPRLFDAAQCRALQSGADAACRVTCLQADEFEPLACDEAPDHGHALVLAVLLSDAAGFSGGELVMTEQRPRLQSRPMVRALRQGDAVLMAVGARTVQGTRGPYRAVLRHGVARVRGGRRCAARQTYAPDELAAP